MVLAAIFLALAFGLTLPTNYALTYSVWERSFNLGGVALFAGAWNTLVWGVPVTVTARWWYLGATRGDPDKSYLWRIYWQSQVGTFAGIIALTVLLLTICALSL